MVKQINIIKNYVLKIATVVLAFFMFVSLGNASLVLDNIQFNPAIIATGDNVDLIVEFHEEINSIDSDKIGNKNYEFQVRLLPDDDLSNKYVIISDSLGDDVFGSIYSGQNYNKKFKLKISQDAPASNYEFKLVGQWYKNGIAESGTQELRFIMPVKKEGITLSLSNIISTPNMIRSGDKEVLISVSLFNSGEKIAKNIVLKFDYPEGISSSYTNNNEILIGVINPFEEKKVNLYLDTIKELKSEVYFLNYSISYQDIDSNTYKKTGTIPIIIKKRPYIEIIESKAIGKAGSDVLLEVKLKNVGEEKAESVDVRVIKQSSQPFEMDVRSSYVGQLLPNETGVAVFKIHANEDAELKEHNLNLAIRAKGDSAEGDSNVYTFSDSAKISLISKADNNYPLYGFVFFLIVVIGTIVFYTLRVIKK